MRWWGKKKEEVDLEQRLPTYEEILNEKFYRSEIPSLDYMKLYLNKSYYRICYDHVNWAIEYLESDLEPVTLMSLPLAKHEYILRLACAKYLEDNSDEN